MKNKNFGSLALAAAVLLLAAQPVLIRAAATPVSNADELLAHHLDAIGLAPARASAKSRVAQGTAQFKFLVGGAGLLEGKSAFVSEGPKFHFMMKFNNNEYKGEQFVFNGDKVEVSFATAQQTRSALGGLVYAQDAVIREGLWGGVLSTAWPLLDLEKRKAKLAIEGLKKVDGKDLYEVRYQPKKRTDLEIRLYFDPETYRHVLTVYTLNVSIGLGASAQNLGNGAPAMGTMDNPGPGAAPSSSETASARQQQTRYRIEERFDDFKTVDGLTLPTHYTIHFTQELQSGRTTVSEWTIQEADLTDNTSLDPRNFDVK